MITRMGEARAVDLARADVLVRVELNLLEADDTGDDMHFAVAPRGVDVWTNLGFVRATIGNGVSSRVSDGVCRGVW